MQFRNIFGHVACASMQIYQPAYNTGYISMAVKVNVVTACLTEVMVYLPADVIMQSKMLSYNMRIIKLSPNVFYTASCRNA